MTVMSIKVTTTRIPAPTTTFIGNPNITTSFFRTAANAPSVFRFRNSRFHKIVPALHVGDALLVALNHDLGAFFNRLAILAARARAAPGATERENNFTSAVFANGHADAGDRADDAAVLFAQRLVGRADKLQQETQDDPARGQPGERGHGHDEKCVGMRILRQHVACSAEPRQEGEHGGSVEPGYVHAATPGPTDADMAASMTSSVSATVEMRQVEMKMQMQFGWNGKMNHASQKRKNTEHHAEQEAEKIEVRPGHASPRGATPRLRRQAVAHDNTGRGRTALVPRKGRGRMTRSRQRTRL